MKKSDRKADVYSAKDYPRKSYSCDGGKTDDETAAKIGELATSPAVAALRVLNAVEGQSGFSDYVDYPSMINLLGEQGSAVINGDMTRLEAMLANQATALQTLFVRLTEKAMSAEYVSQHEIYIKMALRAQSQCRATIETLSAIKNPPVVIAKQANVTSGPQQINNGMKPLSRARGIENEQTKLSGESYELCQDTGTPGFESRVNPALETMAEVNRTKVSRGKGKGFK